MAQRSGTRSSLSRRGFTLVELAVVIAVLAVISAVAIPRFASASARSRLDAAAARVVQDIAVSAASAQAMGSDRQMVFDAPTDQYLLVGVRTRGGGTFRSVRLGDPPYETNIVSATFEGSPLLRLSGYGVPETTGTINLAVGRQGKRIVLNAGTAAVQVRSLDLSDDATGDVLPSVTRDVDAGTIDIGASVSFR